VDVRNVVGTKTGFFVVYQYGMEATFKKQSLAFERSDLAVTWAFIVSLEGTQSLVGRHH